MLIPRRGRRNPMNSPSPSKAGGGPFLLFGALHAAALAAVWVPWFLGLISPEMALPPSSWHAHEFLFGVVPAVIGGVLLTAAPSRTGHPPPAGWPLIMLLAVWIVGRLSLAGSAALEPMTVALLALLFPVALLAVAGREFLLMRNGRNLTILAVLAVLVGAQGLFHWELWRFGRSIQGTRLAVAALLAWTVLEAGIKPGIAGGWRKAHSPSHPQVPSSRIDGVAMGLGLLALGIWIVQDEGIMNEHLSGALLLAAGFAQAARLARWRPRHAPSGRSVGVLRVSCAFIPAGFLLAAWASLGGGTALNAAALHAWTMGAIGGMALTVMARTAAGHSGPAPTASRLTTGIQLAVAAAACARIAAALDPQRTMLLIPLAGALWIAAFLTFVLLHGRISDRWASGDANRHNHAPT
ncbi:NnrS family protein [Azospirillum brasilense]|uniref:NnrS family protein n=1 Tax=Azospirillum brasilense TaxID=192 RepID=UPI0027DCE5F8|nr:NnrS family protein [Azospirillum brasilense]